MAKLSPTWIRAVLKRAVTPLDRVQARIALYMAERQLAGRRDLRTEIRYVAIAKYVQARIEATGEVPKQAIWAAQQEFGVSERTVRTALEVEGCPTRPCK